MADLSNVNVEAFLADLRALSDSIINAPPRRIRAAPPEDRSRIHCYGCMKLEKDQIPLVKFKVCGRCRQVSQTRTKNIAW